MMNSNQSDHTAPDPGIGLALEAVKQGLLAPDGLVRALDLWNQSPQRTLPEILLELELLSSDQIAQVAATLKPSDLGARVSIPAHLQDSTLSLPERADSTLRTEAADSTLAADEAGPSWLPERTGPQAKARLDDSERVSSDQPTRYQIKSERGRGAIGRVMIAFDDHIGREVALKELLAGTGVGSFGTPSQSPARVTAQATARFLREARITGQLEHPGIVPVYEIAKRYDGSLYYTMRLVKGETMAERLKEVRGVRAKGGKVRGPRSEVRGEEEDLAASPSLLASRTSDLAARLKLLPNFLNLCQAMAYAHSKEVIHRDLKPANIIIGEFGETVVLDWGLAKVRGIEDSRADDLEEDLRLIKEAGADETVRGQPIGTPSYMSPEQAEGKIEEIDEASDVWSLGAILHELLTGHPPFLGQSAWEVMSKVIAEPLPPIPELEPRAPAELVAVAAKCLTKEKAGRYPDAAALAEDIARFQSGGMVSAYEYHLPALLRRFLARHWPGVALAAALVIILVVGVSGWFLVSREKERSRYNELLYVFSDTGGLAARGEAEHAEKVLNNFIAKHPEYAMAYFARGYFYYGQKRYNESISDYDRSIALDPEYMDARLNRGLAYSEQGEIARALEDYNYVIEREPEWALAYLNRATAYYRQKDYDRAIADCNRALELEPDNALALTNRAGAYNDKGDYAAALRDYNRALELDPKNIMALLSRAASYFQQHKPDLSRADYEAVIKLDPNNAPAYFNRAEIFYHQADYAAALADFGRAIELDPGNAGFHLERANTLAAAGDAGKALEAYNRAIELDPDLALAYYNRGNLHYNQGDYERARADYDRAIELDPKNSAAHVSRGALSYLQNDLDAAMADFERALELDPASALAFVNRGNVYVRRGETAKARADYDRALTIEPDNLNGRYNRCDLLSKAGELEAAEKDCARYAELAPGDINARIALGNLAFRRGDLEKAAVEFTRALDLNPDYAPARLARAECYYMLKDYERALADYDRGLELDPANVRGWFNRATLHYERKEMAEAVSDFLRVAELDPKDAGAAAGAAWVLATSSDDSLRDPARALELVLRACELTNYQDPTHFDTLAAAYAANGEFDRAMEWQEKAIAGLTPENQAAYLADFKARLELYRQRKPYRE